MQSRSAMFLALGCALLPSGWAKAQGASQGRVGTAATVDQRVTATNATAPRDMRTGAAVMRDDTLTSDAKGRARLQFVDDTLVTFGPSSTLRVAQIVLRSDRRASEFVLDATKGVFRFATGKSGHDAYKIDTPTATLGVRGTQFHFTVNDRETRVAVTQGAVQVCPKQGTSADCKLVRAGQSVRTDSRRAAVTQGLVNMALAAPSLIAPVVGGATRAVNRTVTQATAPVLNDPPPLRAAPDLGGGFGGFGVPVVPIVPIIPGGLGGGSRGGLGNITGGGGLLKR